jgi:hypothetical protein
MQRVCGRVHAVVMVPFDSSFQPSLSLPGNTAPRFSCSGTSISTKQHNARHHPPRSPVKEFNKVRIRGRVHAVVRSRRLMMMREKISNAIQSEITDRLPSQ